MVLHIKKQHKIPKVDIHADYVTDKNIEREMEDICKADYKEVLRLQRTATAGQNDGQQKPNII